LEKEDHEVFLALNESLSELLENLETFKKVSMDYENNIARLNDVLDNMKL
jgi:hypothetical protein